jgi:hypothetical protein
LDCSTTDTATRNREDPTGYSLSVVSFGSDGQPTESATSTTALSPILSNSDTSTCPGRCFRPVGLAWDKEGRLYMSSDTTGEIYVILKSGGLPVDAARPSANAASTSQSYSTAGVIVAVMASICAYFL